jgi:hypothetical protein
LKAVNRTAVSGEIQPSARMHAEGMVWPKAVTGASGMAAFALAFGAAATSKQQT